MLGTVKWFNDSKGFGFIDADDGQGDVFIHYTEIQKDGFKSITEGNRVQFETSESPRGRTAHKLIVIDKETG